MKILFITQEDPIYVARFWDHFVEYSKELDPSIEICGIVSLHTLGKKTGGGLFKRVYGMYGPLGTIAIGLKYLAAKLAHHGIEDYATRLGVPYYRVTKVHSEEFIAFAAEHDLVVSVAASKIFKKKLIEAPSQGFINIHSGPLPAYRGMMPVFWQLKAGEKRIGISIHTIDEQIDGGLILMQNYMPADSFKSLHQAIVSTKRQGAEMMIDLLNNFSSYRAEARAPESDSPSDSEGGPELGSRSGSNGSSYFSFPQRKDAKELRRRGLRLV